MIYQNLITGTKPYMVLLSDRIGYNVLHRHSEIELHYCLKGSYDIIIEDQRYTLTPGMLAIVGSLVPHEIPLCENIGSLVLEFGPTLLKEYFQHFTDKTFVPVCNLNSPSLEVEAAGEMQAFFNEIVSVCESDDAFSELLILSNLYRIANYVVRYFVKGREHSKVGKKDYMISDNIEKSLQLIYNHYQEDITLEQAASLAGYGKTNFCRYFKIITGYSFHRFLNQHRVENACHYLAETKHSLSEIASLVGFADSKILCRVFKDYIGVTPGEYRQQCQQKK